jgi:periplasmic protein TonB
MFLLTAIFIHERLKPRAKSFGTTSAAAGKITRALGAAPNAFNQQDHPPNQSIVLQMTEFEPSQRRYSQVFALAMFGSLLLHLACIVLVLKYTREDDPDPEFGAPAIKIQIELLAKRSEATDLPPGPDAEESKASAPIPEQVKAAEHTPLPQDVPVKTEAPELPVAPVRTKEQVEEEKISVAAPKSPSPVAIAAEARAIPSSEIIEKSESPAAPVQGTGESSQRVRASWQKELIAHLDRHRRYPAGHSLDRVEILVNFIIDETGHVLSSKIIRSSGQTAFDEAALAMIRRSDPLPKPPPLVTQEGLSFTLPVVFRAKR